MKKISVSAPGKLMLFGEHAVVYGYPCIVSAVNKRLEVSMQQIEESILKVDARGAGIRGYVQPISDLGKGETAKGARYLERAVFNFYKKYQFEGGLDIKTGSQFSADWGLGSSSASTVAVLFAMFEIFKKEFTKKELFEIAYQTIYEVAGENSGFDTAAAVWGGTLYFVTGGKVIDKISHSKMNIVVGYSGVKAETKEMIGLVKEKVKINKAAITKIFENISKITEEARSTLLSGDFTRLGVLMNYNQDYLEDLGVSTEKLNAMIETARDCGALGAKLSGAGGGDCMIALVEKNSRENVEEAISAAGGMLLDIELDAEGVR